MASRCPRKMLLLLIVHLGRIESRWCRDVSRSKCSDNISKCFKTFHALQQQINSRLGDKNGHNNAHTPENVWLLSNTCRQFFLPSPGPSQQTDCVQYSWHASRHHVAVDSVCPHQWVHFTHRYVLREEKFDGDYCHWQCYDHYLTFVPQGRRPKGVDTTKNHNTDIQVVTGMMCQHSTLC